MDTLSRNLPLPVALLVALSPGTASAFTIHNSLGDDQKRETITLVIDDGNPMTMTVDSEHYYAKLVVDLPRGQHRYRITGEAVNRDGSRQKITGGGVIVTPARLDGIAEEAPTAAAAFAAYREFVGALASVAPPERYAVLVPSAPVKATPDAVDAAEKRLGIALPGGYKRFITTVGAFRFDRDSYVAGEVFAPDKLGSLLDLVARDWRGNGHDEADIAEMTKRAQRRYPDAAKDIALDVFSLDEPSVLDVDGKCPDGQTPILLPGADAELVATDPGDNPFLALIDYEDDIVGETQCLDYDRLFAYSLHDHLIAMADDVLYVRSKERPDAAMIARLEEDEEAGTIWAGFEDVDDATLEGRLPGPAFERPGIDDAETED